MSKEMVVTASSAGRLVDAQVRRRMASRKLTTDRWDDPHALGLAGRARGVEDVGASRRIGRDRHRRRRSAIRSPSTQQTGTPAGHRRTQRGMSQQRRPARHRPPHGPGVRPERRGRAAHRRRRRAGCRAAPPTSRCRARSSAQRGRRASRPSAAGGRRSLPRPRIRSA